MIPGLSGILVRLKDLNPDAFSFTDQTGLIRNTLYNSNTIYPTGYTAISPISITNGQISINGGAWVTSGYITPGYSLQARMTTNDAWSSSRQATITIGTTVSTWTLTTHASQSGTYDTGYTTTSTTWYAPSYYNTITVQLWGAGGGGAGGGGMWDTVDPNTYYGTNGSDAGYAQFGGGPIAYGGTKGTGGGNGKSFGDGGGYGGNGTNGSNGSYGNCTSGTVGGAGNGGSGGLGCSAGAYSGGNGGNGGAGGYGYRYYSWGQLTPGGGYSIYIGDRGSNGEWTPGYYCFGGIGTVGGYGRIYISWN